VVISMTIAFREATKTNPCQICGKTKYCSESEDSVWGICRFLDTGEGVRKQDRNGADYFVYRLKDSNNNFEPVFESDNNNQASLKTLDPHTLNRVYDSLFKKLNLSPEHRENLLKRGLTDEEIVKRNYKTLSLPGRSKLGKYLISRFDVETCSSVPGIYLKSEDNKSWWSIAGSPGILIPVRDIKGRIVACKIRRDDGRDPRYTSLSSKKYGGASPGSKVHVSLYGGKTTTARLTEGELKADVSTCLSGVLTISIPGVSNWRQAVPVLQEMGVKTVLLAFDMDAPNNFNVARALSNTFDALNKEGFDVQLERWNGADGKGIDDLLAAGKVPEVITGTEARKAIKQILKTASETDPMVQSADKAEQARVEEARVKVRDFVSKFREKPNPINYFHDVEAQRNIAALPVAEQAAVWIELKELAPRLNLIDAKRAVKEITGQAKKNNFAAAHGLIQRGGRYYVEKMTKDGPVQVVVSNFVIEPVVKLILPDGKEMLHVDVYVGGSEQPAFSRLLSTGDLLGRRDLLKALGSVTTQWIEGDNTVQMLVGHLAKVDVPVRMGVPFIGLYKDRFITPDAVFNTDGSEGDSVYTYVPQKVIFEDYVKFPACDEWTGFARKVLKRLLYLAPPQVIIPVVGWFFAAIVAPIIRKKWGEFPILHCWGTGGSGKTSLILLFLKLLGVLSEPFSTAMKEFAMIKLLSCTNALPVFLDEYRPGHTDPRRLKSFHEKLLLIYKASKESRGRPDQTTIEYKLMAPVVMAGEAPLPETETGLRERIVQVRFERNYLDDHPEAEIKFNELTDLPLEEFAAGFVPWVMRKDILKVLEWAASLVGKYTTGMRVPIRVKHNLSVMLVGVYLFDTLAQELSITVRKIDIESVCRKLAGEDNNNRREPRNAVDRFVLHMEAMARTGEIQLGVDYFLDDTQDPAQLIFFTNAVISAQSKYCKSRGLDNELISDRALRVMLEEDPSGYVIVPYGKRVRIGDFNRRCSILNSNLLEQKLDVPVDTWRDSQQRDFNKHKEEVAQGGVSFEDAFDFN